MAIQWYNNPHVDQLTRNSAMMLERDTQRKSQLLNAMKELAFKEKLAKKRVKEYGKNLKALAQAEDAKISGTQEYGQGLAGNLGKFQELTGTINPTLKKAAMSGEMGDYGLGLVAQNMGKRAFGNQIQDIVTMRTGNEGDKANYTLAAVTQSGVVPIARYQDINELGKIKMQLSKAKADGFDLNTYMKLQKMANDRYKQWEDVMMSGNDKRIATSLKNNKRLLGLLKSSNLYKGTIKRKIDRLLKGGEAAKGVSLSEEEISALLQNASEDVRNYFFSELVRGMSGLDPVAKNYYQWFRQQMMHTNPYEKMNDKELQERYEKVKEELKKMEEKLNNYKEEERQALLEKKRKLIEAIANRKTGAWSYGGGNRFRIPKK